MFDMAETTTFNSIGIRFWLNFIRNFALDRTLKFQHCNQDIVSQVATIPQFLGKGKILSFYVHFSCPECENEAKTLLEGTQGVEDTYQNLEIPFCQKCQVHYEPEADEDTYFVFMSRFAG